MNHIKEIFSGKEGNLSSKRIIGFLIISISLWLAIDAHYTERTLDETFFTTAMTVGGAMIGVGVAEGLMDKFKTKKETPQDMESM